MEKVIAAKVKDGNVVEFVDAVEGQDHQKEEGPEVEPEEVSVVQFLHVIL